MRDKQTFLALINVKRTDKFGKLQTMNVTVNRNATDKTEIKSDVEWIVKLAGSSIKRYSVVGNIAPFPHGSLDIFFENEVLARYVYTQTSAEAFADWRLYMTGAEVHLREGCGVIESKRAVPEAETDRENVDGYLKEIEDIPLSPSDREAIESMIAEIF